MALPSTATNNIASQSGSNVKQEKRDDDEEINELAEKMREANKAKMAGGAVRPPGTNGTLGQPVQTQQMVNSTQPAILNFLTRNNSGAPASKTQQTQPSTGSTQNSTEKPPCDADSVKMHFGWVTLGKSHIPYILRYGSEKYCAVRMVEMKLLSKYLTYLHADIYSCTCIRSYYITEAEARLLNDINIRHCDYQFGREPFTTKDLVVRLQDADEFYTFLDVCYNKLLPQNNSNSNKCGFIRIDGESVVPYILRNGIKYVPVFYFEGDTCSLIQKSETLEGWDLAYLKFCCKVQGIKAELFEKDNCSVISLEDINGFFPADTNFEDYWPSKVVDRQLLVSTAKSDSSATWTISPTVSSSAVPPQPPPINKVPGAVSALPRQTAHSAPYMNQPMSNGWSGLVGGQPTYHSSSSRMMHNGSMPMGMVSPGSAVQPPPPLVRVTSSQSAMGRANAAAAMYSSAGSGMQHMMSMGQHASQMLPPQQPHAHYPSAPANSKYPPPLVSVNGTTVSSTYSFMTSNGIDVIDLSSSPQSPQMSQRQHHGSNGKTPSSMERLIQIQDYHTSGPHIPFKVQKALVAGKMVPCINAKPYVYTDLLMTLHDLNAHFFPDLSITACKQGVQEVLGIHLFRGNRQQMQMLKEAGKCTSTSDILPLVQVKDVMQFMPQMKYMFTSRRPAGPHGEPPAKMKRTS
ncbi:Protein transport protein Sec31A [Frankliniella fusca]|uniref:Protein transport protein Sec31A n=1 Tax=Frankliniella fusca TaxID=407009 RepID=A0AAE1GWP6_9NEOP|nr:Protein transport protein Sec31A [Frankliniella fusca]